MWQIMTVGHDPLTCRLTAAPSPTGERVWTGAPMNEHPLIARRSLATDSSAGCAT